jgi:DNA-binding response OmpR family regulator
MLKARPVTNRHYRGNIRSVKKEFFVNPDGDKKNCRTLLLVEDDKEIAYVEMRFLEMDNYHVVLAINGQTALDIIRKNEQTIDLVLMDIDLGKGMDGTECAREILKIREIPVIFLSSHIEERIVKKTEDINSYGYIVKGVGFAVLSASIRMALNLYDAREIIKVQKSEIDALNDELESAIEDLEEIDDEFLNSTAAHIESEFKNRKIARQQGLMTAAN